MNLESLKIFCNVVEAGGFSKAVNRCHLSQSAISKQVRALEDELGQKLLDRSTHTLNLTQAGQLLYERSEKIFGEIDETKGLLQGFSGAQVQRLSIGTSLSIGISYFPGIFTNFTKHLPKCRLDVQVEYTSALIRAVEQRELDCAVVCLPRRLPKNVLCGKKFLDPLTLVASHAYVQKHAKEKLRDEKRILALLQEEPLILIGSRNYTRKIIDHYLFEHGIHVEPALELDSFDLIVSFVSLGLGLSIVPQRVLPVYARSRSVSCRKLANLNLQRELGIIVHKDRQHHPLLKEFIRFFSF